MYRYIRYIKLLSFWMLMMALGFQACEDPYMPELEEDDASRVLIVDGFIDVSGQSEFKVGYSTPVYSSPGPIWPTPMPGTVSGNFQVTVVSENGQVYPGTWSPQQGSFVVNHPSLDLNTAYFVRIQAGSDLYESAPTKAIRSGEIGSLEYQVQDDGINILVSSEDPTHGSPYYRWEFEESWKFHSAVKPSAVVQNGALVDITPETDYGTCFRFSQSSNILIASTLDFAENRVFQWPVQAISKESEKLGVRYSILVKQYAISSASYAFWELIRKNSEQIGDIFGVMPSEIHGNIYNVNDPLEKVVGFVEVLQPTEKRIFINNFEMPAQWMAVKDYPYYSGCAVPDTLTMAEAPAFFQEFPSYLPGWFIYANPASPNPTHVNFSYARCVDCRFFGQMEKPEYWIE